jgi:hypothetical protein
VKRPKRYYLTFLWTGIWDVLLWVFLVLFRLFFGKRLFWQNGLWCEIRKGSWFYKVWAVLFSGMTLGHGGLYGPGVPGGPEIDTGTEFHEHIHVEQFEAAMLLSFVVGVVMLISGSEWWVSALVWLLGGSTAYYASLAQAWLRGEKPYRGSHLEESAYSQTDLWRQER